MNQASCLQLVTDLVITRDTVYLSAVVANLRADGMVITSDSLARILPTMSEHINRLGRYEFGPAAVSLLTSVPALPLRTETEMVEQPGLSI